MKRPRKQEKTMTAPKKTAVVMLALAGALMGGIALAQDDAPDMPRRAAPVAPVVRARTVA